MKELIEKLDRIIDILEKKCNFDTTDNSNSKYILFGPYDSVKFFNTEDEVADYLISKNYKNEDRGYDPDSGRIDLEGPDGIKLYAIGTKINSITYRG